MTIAMKTTRRMMSRGFELFLFNCCHQFTFNFPVEEHGYSYNNEQGNWHGNVKGGHRLHNKPKKLLCLYQKTLKNTPKKGFSSQNARLGWLRMLTVLLPSEPSPCPDLEQY